MESKKPGTLYIVATPIGNLGDISQRAADVLAQADVIAAEDTRHSQKLLQYLDIANKQVLACHDHSRPGEVERLLQLLQQGKDIALISDAGTPLISDPGYGLVNIARQHHIAIFAIPGASAVTAALSVAGLATDRFVFEGFLPAKNAARLGRLQDLQLERRTMVFFETPHRIMAFLQDAITVFGGHRLAFLGRELTKKFEQHYGQDLASIQGQLQQAPAQQKGEFVVVISGCTEQDSERARLAQAMDLVALLRPHLSLKQAVGRACEYTGARKNSVYEQALLLERQVHDDA
ncbi:MAG: 16S rRNA (cytidine(1402)-2'-O)-methyltransferase [Gammaproteobacteria bacterium]